MIAFVRMPLCALFWATLIAAECSAEEGFRLEGIDGCYEPSQLEANSLGYSSFKSALLLGSVTAAPRFVAVRSISDPLGLEILLFDRDTALEIYRVGMERNQIRIAGGAMTFRTPRVGAGEGVTLKTESVFSLTPTADGDLHADVEVTMRSTTFLVFSKKTRGHISFDLRRLKNKRAEELRKGGGVADLPGIRE